MLQPTFFQTSLRSPLLRGELQLSQILRSPYFILREAPILYTSSKLALPAPLHLCVRPLPRLNPNNPITLNFRKAKVELFNYFY